FVARYVGDGVLIYFGWPLSDETNAERAVRAGLAVIDAVGRTSSGAQALRVRVGIASSVLVVGGSTAPGAAPEHPDAGEALNLSAGLQALAEPNTIVIDQVTRAQIGGLFDCEELPRQTVKGYPDPIRAWRVHGESTVVSRFEALHAARLSRFIGRDEEIELL